MASQPSREFQQQVIDFLPRMRVWARTLTRNAVAADDLVQDVAVKALQAHEMFVPDTNFPAWMRRIMYNHFVSGTRQKREATGLDKMPEIPIAASQQNHIDIRELGLALRDLPEEQMAALRLIAIQEVSYEDASVSTGIPIGTLKSRVHRARLQLRSHMGHQVSGVRPCGWTL